MPKTRKNSSTSKIKGIVVLEPNDNFVSGTILLNEVRKGITLEYTIEGLSDGAHGFHIHEYGDLTDECKSACSHFNPDNIKHGGLNSKERHAGDLGNIISKKKNSFVRIEELSITRSSRLRRGL